MRSMWEMKVLVMNRLRFQVYSCRTKVEVRCWSWREMGVCGGCERKRRREPGGVRGVSGCRSGGRAGEASAVRSRVPLELHRLVTVGGEGGVSDVSQGCVRR